MFGLPIKKRSQIQKEKLKDFSDEELLECLNKNEELDASFLACICSEVLRRRLNIAKEIPKSKGI